LPHSDIAEFLQARIVADLKAELAAHTPGENPQPDERPRIAALEAQIATLMEAVAAARTLDEQRRQEAETAAKRAEALEAHIARLEKAVADAEALGEQRRQEAEIAVKRADYLVAELVDITSELVEMSKRDDRSDGNTAQAARSALQDGRAAAAADARVSKA
jgi:chromosome segregation ATPase